MLTEKKYAFTKILELIIFEYPDDKRFNLIVMNCALCIPDKLIKEEDIPLLRYLCRNFYLECKNLHRYKTFDEVPTVLKCLDNTGLSEWLNSWWSENT